MLQFRRWRDISLLARYFGSVGSDASGARGVRSDMLDAGSDTSVVGWWQIVSDSVRSDTSEMLEVLDQIHYKPRILFGHNTQTSLLLAALVYK